MMHRDAGDFNGRDDIAANVGANAANTDDVKCGTSEWLNRGGIAQPRV